MHSSETSRKQRFLAVPLLAVGLVVLVMLGRDGARASLDVPAFTLQAPSPETGASFGLAMATGDIDGDGLDDLLIGAFKSTVDGIPQTGQVFVYFGSSTFDGTPDMTLRHPTLEEDARFGSGLSTGDVNGDGMDDVIVLQAAVQSQSFVFLGSSPLDTTVDVTLPIAGPLTTGDLTGDGRDEVIVRDGGAASVFLGGDPFDATMDLTLEDPDPESGSAFGTSLATADVNGDGREDLVIGADGSDVSGLGSAGEAFVFMGGDPFDTTADFTLQDPSPAALENFGDAAAGGDVNGDGKGDFIVAATFGSIDGLPSGQVIVFLGGDPFDGTADVILQDPEPQPLALFGRGLAAGDLNGDGNDDVVVGAHSSNVGIIQDEGEAFVFLGGGTLDGAADFALQDPIPEPSSFFGRAVTVGDVNGDGLVEVIAAAANSDIGEASGAGEAFVFLGGPKGVDADEDGCTNDQETALLPEQGGARNPKYFWDFMDQWTGDPPERSRSIVVGDIGAVVARFGTARLGGAPSKDEALAEALLPPTDVFGYHASSDRGPGSGAPLEPLPPDGSIVIGDIGAVVAQFGHSCA